MKVILVIPTLELAGAEVMCKNLALELKKENYDVVVLSLYNRETALAKTIRENGIKVIFLDKTPGLDITMIGKLKKVFKIEKPDVVHTHLDSLKYSFVAAKLAKVPQCVHTVHNLAEKEADKYTRVIYRFAFKMGKVIPVALSEEVQNSIMGVYGMDKKHIPVIYNGIDLDACIQKQSYANNPKIIFINVARFMYQKNHSMLINAYKELAEQADDTELWLVGKGQLLDEIRQQAERLHIASKVRFLGERTDVLELLNRADVFILPSLYEGMPMTIIEAMGTGLPIIATNVGGIPTMIEHDVDGYLVECDEEELVAAMKKMCSSKERERMGKKAAEIATQRFSVKSMTEGYCQLYNELR